jgi:hypothetical protein
MDAHAKGMPRLRSVFVPQPVMGKSDEELRAYVEGLDPISGKRVMEEVVEALTRPLDVDDRVKVHFERTTPRTLVPATEEALHRLFLENQWTDRLPIILPTEGRVEEMLAGTSRHPDEVVGTMAPTSTRQGCHYTVEKVAVNAVMAGARPEYLPVILALASSGVSARGSTTSSMAAMVVVNGPIRHQLGMNWGIGAMGPYNHANATIGRAYGLLSQNLQGGSSPGETYLGSQGNNYAYNSITFAENEEGSPWRPFHVQHGYQAEDSVASVFADCVSTSFSLGLREKHWREHVQNMLRGMDTGSPPTLLLDPIVARLFVDRGGFDSKEKLIRWIHSAATLPSSVYWDLQEVQNHVYPLALKGAEPYASMLRTAGDELVPMFLLDDIQVIVVGGETNGYWRIMGARHQESASIDEWM